MGTECWWQDGHGSIEGNEHYDEWHGIHRVRGSSDGGVIMSTWWMDESNC